MKPSALGPREYRLNLAAFARETAERLRGEAPTLEEAGDPIGAIKASRTAAVLEGFAEHLESRAEGGRA